MTSPHRARYTRGIQKNPTYPPNAKAAVLPSVQLDELVSVNLPMALAPWSVTGVQCSARGISRVLRPVHCPFVGASVPEYHNPVVADFLSQARPAGRFVSSDSGGVDRPLTNPAERRYVCGPS